MQCIFLTCSSDIGWKYMLVLIEILLVPSTWTSDFLTPDGYNLTYLEWAFMRVAAVWRLARPCSRIVYTSFLLWTTTSSKPWITHEPWKKTQWFTNPGSRMNPEKNTQWYTNPGSRMNPEKKHNDLQTLDHAWTLKKNTMIYKPWIMHEPWKKKQWFTNPGSCMNPEKNKQWFTNPGSRMNLENKQTMIYKPRIMHEPWKKTTMIYKPWITHEPWSEKGFLAIQ